VFCIFCLVSDVILFVIDFNRFDTLVCCLAPLIVIFQYCINIFDWARIGDHSAKSFIWFHNYDIWKFRCNINHGTTQQDKRSRALLRLKPKVEALYNKQQDIDPIDLNIFEKTQEEMLLLSINIIDKWVHKAHIRIYDSIKRQKQKPRQTNHPIRNFVYRVILAAQQPLPQCQQQNIAPNPLVVTRRRTLIATTLGNFFQLRRPPERDHQIVIPHNDDRPP
jgi:hypothetical protein